MNPTENMDVSKTVEIFDLQVDQQMLPQGLNPVGRGGLLKSSENGLSLEDVPRLILGHVELQEHVVEHGNEVALEKAGRYTRPVNHPDFSSGLTNRDTGSIRKNWENMVKAKNNAKFNPKTLKIVRDELDNLLKKAENPEHSIASSDNSAGTWASFAPIPEEAPIEKIIAGYSEMTDERKVDALRNELPPFDENDIKYTNLKFALGTELQYKRIET